jgi:phytoene dehydrogenase-like protein
MSSALVVGSGPNGLAAAVTLARAGWEVTVLEASDAIGGGTRTVEALVPGLLHDTCSAFHPMAVGSPFLSNLGLERYGLTWVQSEIDCVHPLDDGTAGVLYQSVEQTADGLGRDRPRWMALFERNVRRYHALSEDILQSLLHLPHHPLALARFGLPTLLPASSLVKFFRTPQARALFGGVASHAFQPLHRPLTSAIGLGIITAGHRDGWGVAAGGSRSITAALAGMLTELGGMIETGSRVSVASELPPADVTMFNLDPPAIARILGDRLPTPIRRAFARFRFGPAAFKVDFAVEEGVPWSNPYARRAGTVHLGGGYAEVADNERAIHAGRMPSRPFTLVGQQYLADPQRSVGNVHPLWTYAQVPHGFDGDATPAVIAQLERFAPGFRERVIGHTAFSPTRFAAYNTNYVGGDINTGAEDIARIVFGPRKTLSPYSLGVPGMYICSAATPPGPGAHGMCGYNAARAALKALGHPLT